MERTAFESVDPLVDKFEEPIDELLDGERLESLKQTVLEISQILGDRYSVMLEFNLKVHDSQRENALPLLQAGFVATDGAKPYRYWGDSTPHRFIVEESRWSFHTNIVPTVGKIGISKNCI